MILVTGGTGFLGSYIIRHLIEKGYPVRAIRRSRKLPFDFPDPVWSAVEWVEGDVLDPISLHDAMDGAKEVIHAAAVVSFDKKHRSSMYQVNVDGTANVVNAALDTGIQRLIHVSSVAALGRSLHTEMINEEKKWEAGENHTHYAMSKHEAEMHAWRGFAEGLDGVIVNPSTILGFGNWNQTSCALFKSCYNEFSWYTQGVNGFTGVEDVARAILLLLRSGDIQHQRFIINTDNWNFRHLFNLIADQFHKKRPQREASPALGMMAWQLEKVKSLVTGTPPLLTKETVKVAHSKSSFDNSKLLRALPGFHFTALEDIIKKTCENYLQALQLGVLK